MSTHDLKPWDAVTTPSGRVGLIVATEVFAWSRDVRADVWIEGGAALTHYGLWELEWVEGDRGEDIRTAYRAWRAAQQ